MESFFKPQRVYAVVGATTNRAKYGNKVLQWYIDRKIPVTPIAVRKEMINGIESITSIKDLRVTQGAKDIGLSIVTPPSATLELLQTIQENKLPVTTAWFQPGTYDDSTVEFAKKVIPSVILDCVLVKGDWYFEPSDAPTPSL